MTSPNNMTDEETSGGDIVTVYTLTDSEDTAVHLGTTLVREKLVACANVGQSIRSVYEWNGTVQLEAEIPLFLKTTMDKVELVTQRIKELHTYEIPCITVWPIVAGNEDYFGWVRQQVAEGGQHKVDVEEEERHAG